jgi:hypothetical protein
MIKWHIISSEALVAPLLPGRTIPRNFCTPGTSLYSGMVVVVVVVVVVEGMGG